MSGVDYFEDGAWNVRCQECFRKYKSFSLRKRWDNFWVCDFCFEQRNPQDFIRGIPDNPSTPWRTGDDPREPLAPPPSSTCLLPTQKRGWSMLIGSFMLDSSLLG